MTKLFAIAAIVAALTACSSMSGTNAMGNTAPNSGETKNSTDANKSGNPAAVSPGPGSSSGGATSGTR